MLGARRGSSCGPKVLHTAGSTVAKRCEETRSRYYIELDLPILSRPDPVIKEDHLFNVLPYDIFRMDKIMCIINFVNMMLASHLVYYMAMAIWLSSVKTNIKRGAESLNQIEIGFHYAMESKLGRDCDRSVLPLLSFSHIYRPLCNIIYVIRGTKSISL